MPPRPVRAVTFLLLLLFPASWAAPLVRARFLPWCLGEAVSILAASPTSGRWTPRCPCWSRRSRFFSTNHARVVVADWVTDFNTARPHSAIGYMTPVAYAATLNLQRASALRDIESSTPTPVATVAPTRNSPPP